MKNSFIFILLVPISLNGMENMHSKKAKRKKHNSEQLLLGQIREINSRLQQIKLNRIKGSMAFKAWKEENPTAKLTDFYKELKNEEQGLLRKKFALGQLQEPTLLEREKNLDQS